jgi:hypothetical protein
MRSVKLDDRTYNMLLQMSKKSQIDISLFLEALVKKEYATRK